MFALCRFTMWFLYVVLLCDLVCHKICLNYTDMRAERNTLARYVYPQLRDFCMKLNMDFQVVDMRWGVTEDSQNDHSVEELCLQEVKNCQKYSRGPNFIVSWPLFYLVLTWNNAVICIYKSLQELLFDINFYTIRMNY